jgi:hypothetical protein
MKNRMKRLTLIKTTILILIISAAGFISCNDKPEPQPLPYSVLSTLNLLQENPQFVMYLNFKNMRRTVFWQKNVSDSILNSEKTFGSLLNTFKLATGASISDGLDELYYSNSWFGENAIVIKGVIDRSKLIKYITEDSLFSVAREIDGKTIYMKNDNGLYFYFRDNNTICASNYLKQIDLMINVKDTSETGLLQNEKVLNSIKNIVYKDDMWMVSTERFFIRGIFQNFLLSTSGIKTESNDSSDSPESGLINDSAASKDKPTVENIYKRFSAISFSSKMSENLNLLIQCECINEESSKFLRSILNGLISVAKLNSAGNKKQNSLKFLDDLKINRYDNSVFIDLIVDDNNISELRKTNLINEPE